jgi:hypothetical protein
MCRGVEGVQITLNEYLDHWLNTAAKPKLREKTYRDYEAMLRRYIQPKLVTKSWPCCLRSIFRAPTSR